MGKVPPNLGLVFRQFALSYDRKLKQDIPISKESRRWWHRLLEQLAWVMTCGEEKTELQVAIPRQKAEAVLTEFLAGKVAHPEDCVLSWLEDLLNHHLIQLGVGDRIEFRHQLIQEYYTAEYLLKVLPSLSDDEVKREYLNYLKWTEPLALMLELVEDEVQAMRVVKLALEVDLRLGARLAGAVKPNWQEQTLSLVAALNVPQQLKIPLLGYTRSNQVIPNLLQALHDEDSDAYWHITKDVHHQAIKALETIGSETAVDALQKALNHKDSVVRSSTVEALKKISSELVVNILQQALNHEDVTVRWTATSALGEIGSEGTVEVLLPALNHEDSFVRRVAADALGKIGSKKAVEPLLPVLRDDEDSDVRKSATAFSRLVRYNNSNE
jgi:HEAT repeat protein